MLHEAEAFVIYAIPIGGIKAKFHCTSFPVASP